MLANLIIALFVVFSSSTILLFACSLIKVDWDKAKSDGVSIQLAVYGGYRNSWAQLYIKEGAERLMVALDTTRYYSTIIVCIVFLASMIIGLVNA